MLPSSLTFLSRASPAKGAFSLAAAAAFVFEEADPAAALAALVARVVEAFVVDAFAVDLGAALALVVAAGFFAAPFLTDFAAAAVRLDTLRVLFTAVLVSVFFLAII